MLIPKILKKIIKALNLKHRVIYRDAEETDLYLTRYYVFRKTKWWMPSVYIHCFHSSDHDLELHNHGWRMSLSMILSGSYWEERRINKDNSIINRTLRPGSFNFIKANTFHRVELQTPEVWSIFISGPKIQNWGFWDRWTHKFEYWQEHEKRKKLEKSITPSA